MLANGLKAVLVLAVGAVAMAAPACDNGAKACRVEGARDLEKAVAKPAVPPYVPQTAECLQVQGGVLWVRLESIAQGRVLLKGEGMWLEAGQTYILAGDQGAEPVYTLTDNPTAVLDLGAPQALLP